MVLSAVTRPVGRVLRKFRDFWETFTGTDTLDEPTPPRDPAERPGTNVSGNIGGIGGGANW